MSKKRRYSQEYKNEVVQCLLWARSCNGTYVNARPDPDPKVDAMLAADPFPRHYNPVVSPVVKLLKGLKDKPEVSDLVVEKPDYRLELRG